MDNVHNPYYLAEADMAALVQCIEEHAEDDWQRFLHYTEELRVEPGDVLIRQFDEDRDVYVLTSGELEIRVAAEPDGSELVIATATPFAIVGEQSFLDNGVRTATVAACAPSTVHRLTPGSFDALCQGAPDLACAFLFDIARFLSLRNRVEQI